MPTDDEILRVKTNIRNMQSFNDHVYNYGNAKIINAYALLSQSDNSDLGLQIGINLLCGSFWAIGGPFGALGAIGANFMAGLVGAYAVTTPPSLNAQFSSLMNRFQTTSIQVDTDLSMMYDNPTEYWDTVYTGTVNNPFGSYTASGSLSQLATIDFPAETNTEFEAMVNTAIYALDQEIWSILLGRFVITKYEPETDFPISMMPDDAAMNTWAAGFYAINKSYWNNWYYHEEYNKKGANISYYETYQNNIGTGATMFSDGHLADSACDYLFIDSADNVIINPNGLFHRNYVFNNLVIPHKIKIYTNEEHTTRMKTLGLHKSS